MLTSSQSPPIRIDWSSVKDPGSAPRKALETAVAAAARQWLETVPALAQGSASRGAAAATLTHPYTLPDDAEEGEEEGHVYYIAENSFAVQGAAASVSSPPPLATMRASCFNCGGNHFLARCQTPVDAKRVALARRLADEGGSGGGGSGSGNWRGRFFADSASSTSSRHGGDVMTPAHPLAAALPPPSEPPSSALCAALGLAPGSVDPLAMRVARFGPPPALVAAAAGNAVCSMHSMRCTREYATNGALSAIVASFDAGCPIAQGAASQLPGAACLFHAPGLPPDLLLRPMFLPHEPRPFEPVAQQEAKVASPLSENVVPTSIANS